MRVAANQLLGYIGRDVVDRPRMVVTFRGDSGVEQDLEQEVAEFLAQVVIVAGLDRLESLVGLLEQVGGQAAVGLLGVPWTPAWRPQSVHDCDEFQQAVAGGGMVGVPDAFGHSASLTGGLDQWSCSAGASAPSASSSAPPSSPAGVEIEPLASSTTKFSPHSP